MRMPFTEKGLTIMLTLRELVDNTPSSIRKRSKHLRMYWRVKGEQRNGYRLYKMHCKPPRTDKSHKVFTQWIRVYHTRGKSLRAIQKSKVWVRCSCQFFLYTLEVVLSKSGTTTIKYSNGDDPETRNPQNVPYLCKHLYKAMANMLDREQRIRQVAFQQAHNATQRDTRVVTPRFMNDMRSLTLVNRVRIESGD